MVEHFEQHVCRTNYSGYYQNVRIRATPCTPPSYGNGTYTCHQMFHYDNNTQRNGSMSFVLYDVIVRLNTLTHAIIPDHRADRQNIQIEQHDEQTRYSTDRPQNEHGWWQIEQARDTCAPCIARRPTGISTVHGEEMRKWFIKYIERSINLWSNTKVEVVQFGVIKILLFTFKTRSRNVFYYFADCCSIEMIKHTLNNSW